MDTHTLAQGDRLVAYSRWAGQGLPICDVNNNVYRVTVDGNVVWQLARHELLEGVTEDPIVRIWEGDGDLCVRSYFGRIYEVDLKTGEAHQVDWTK